MSSFLALAGQLVGRALSTPDANSREQKISATVIANPFINRVDLKTIGPAVEKCSRPRIDYH